MAARALRGARAPAARRLGARAKASRISTRSRPRFWRCRQPDATRHRLLQMSHRLLQTSHRLLQTSHLHHPTTTRHRRRRRVAAGPARRVRRRAYDWSAYLEPGGLEPGGLERDAARAAAAVRGVLRVRAAGLRGGGGGGAGGGGVRAAGAAAELAAGDCGRVEGRLPRGRRRRRRRAAARRRRRRAPGRRRLGRPVGLLPRPRQFEHESRPRPERLRAQLGSRPGSRRPRAAPPPKPSRARCSAARRAIWKCKLGRRCPFAPAATTAPKEVRQRARREQEEGAPPRGLNVIADRFALPVRQREATAPTTSTARAVPRLRNPAAPEHGPPMPPPPPPPGAAGGGLGRGGAGGDGGDGEPRL